MYAKGTPDSLITFTSPYIVSNTELASFELSTEKGHTLEYVHLHHIYHPRIQGGNLKDCIIEDTYGVWVTNGSANRCNIINMNPSNYPHLWVESYFTSNFYHSNIINNQGDTVYSLVYIQ